MTLHVSAKMLCVFIEVMFILKAFKFYFKGYMINRILYSCSCHMKYMKPAEARLINFI